ncbi:hypothetical protein K466DRAFT_347035 [Polyporus arcularius HHB13444]|uniref:Carbohydrate-binding module family 13 protein n=1 Tax=Polyporus arcularius HHB13444 TaxID=1314778 RepID=A0A5C3NXE4_9APHY|nr:hypothetical protein K466DRAFT_347035 [Polyporus arcularius HHB13444]
MFPSASLLSLALASGAFAQTYSATYLPSNAPKTSEQGQSGTNQCGTGSDQNSMCQNLYINGIDDFCLFAPPTPGAASTIGNTERIEVAWCLKPGYGTRLIPDGAITGAHFVQTPDYVQVTGVGDLTKLNIPNGTDGGGELDPHGADGNGNPIGGLVFSSAFGDLQQIHEWTNFMAVDEFCIRACKDGPKAPALCQHIYDVMGCAWNMPGNYDAGSFDACKGDTGEPMGVYGTSTFRQGQPATPPAHDAPKTSSCSPVSTVGSFAASTSASVTGTSTSTSTSSGAAATGTQRTSGTGSSTGSASPSPTGGAGNGAAPLQVGSGGLGMMAAGLVAVFGAALVA